MVIDRESMLCKWKSMNTGPLNVINEKSNAAIGQLCLLCTWKGLKVRKLKKKIKRTVMPVFQDQVLKFV